MDYLVAVLLPQLLHGLVFGAALGLLALGLTVIFGLLGVMNFAHGELYMLGAYAGIAVVGVTHSFWTALIVAPLAVGAIGAVTEVVTLRPLYRREPLYGLGRAGGAGRLAASADLHRLSADGRGDDPARVHRGDPRGHGLDGRLGRRRPRHRARPVAPDPLDEPPARRHRDLRAHDRRADRPAAGLLRPRGGP